MPAMYNDPNQPKQPPYNQPPQAYGQPGFQSGYGTPPQAYNQQGAGANPQYSNGIPNYEAPPPPKKSRKTLWIVLGIVGGLLVLGCAACGLILTGVIKFGTQLAEPAIAITTYYEDLKNQNYAQAYTYLDPQLLTVQGQTVTVDIYAAAQASLDKQFGPVSSFTLSNIQIRTDTATITVQETRIQTRTIIYTLRRIGNNWKISGVNNGPGLPTTN